MKLAPEYIKQLASYVESEQGQALINAIVQPTGFKFYIEYQGFMHFSNGPDGTSYYATIGWEAGLEPDGSSTLVPLQVSYEWYGDKSLGDMLLKLTGNTDIDTRAYAIGIKALIESRKV
jgi:hypothetical protein